LISEAARAEGAYLVNRHGERFMKRYAPERMELAPRDVVSRAIYFECLKGNGFVHESGLCYVGLDIRHLDPERVKQRLPLLLELSKTYAGVDPLNELIPVRPAVHYFMGGIMTDIEGRALDRDGNWVRGLWAAGEAASTGVHGANRLGSNSLAECAVWGRLAGEAVAAYAKGRRPARELVAEAVKAEEERINGLLRREGGGESVRGLLKELQNLMEGGGGIVRSERAAVEALKKLTDLRGRFNNVRISDGGRIYNMELREVLELDGMLLAAEAVLLGALLRQESRGAHYRVDFQNRDDKRWLVHSVYFLYGGNVMTKQRPVNITRWMPEARRY
jgi:succinate dehydrogenase / fumarate reductase flavoprotein subunit